MKTDTRERPAAESYATFWEPRKPITDPVPAPRPSADGEADAYDQFVEATEGAPAARG